ncbi:hypothetical protein GYMLUDRAFT_921415 [Collybiopsis luxurians FD-317 M1]|uniref:non-specific serine/threonine protein kinase n=1 Tax=Collybiopsis luxurians FD-317 M1 TaxID=944289 RepID=A0A0D0C7T6_9AGAR|nr:hypothetical protein GYMLUDRAFT_921415 [Collybiopsis luxurians FD-317 M1]
MAQVVSFRPQRMHDVGQPSAPMQHGHSSSASTSAGTSSPSSSSPVPVPVPTPAPGILLSRLQPSVVTTSLVQTTRLPTGQKMINQYIMDAKVGSGQHGNVWRCYEHKHAYLDWAERERRVLAMKIVKRDSPKARRERQYKMLRMGGKLGGQGGGGGGNGNGAAGNSGGGGGGGNGSSAGGGGGGLGTGRRTQPTVVDGIRTTEQNIRKEIAIMKKCRHPHVVRLYEVIDDRKNEMIFMVMEYLGGGEIQYTSPTNKGAPILTVEQTRRIMRDAILGLEYLHHQGIIHRDIKPANLLWSTGHERVKIADFGTAHFSYAQRLAAAKASNSPTLLNDSENEEDDPLLLNEADLAKRAGTPAFLAPEIVWEFLNWNKARRFYPSYDDPSPPPPPPTTTGERAESGSEALSGGENDEGATTTSILYPPPPPRPPVTKSIDIWALGVTLYCLLFGKIPFWPPERKDEDEDRDRANDGDGNGAGDEEEERARRRRRRRRRRRQRRLEAEAGNLSESERKRNRKRKHGYEDDEDGDKDKEKQKDEEERLRYAPTEWVGYDWVCNREWRAEERMGRDGVVTGGRYPDEWDSASEESDEDEDDEEEEEEEDGDNEEDGDDEEDEEEEAQAEERRRQRREETKEGRLVIHLLDHLLQKDLEMRITLEEVKLVLD